MATCSKNSKADADDEINDPGAAPYGNFINYYSFNPPENRLSLIPPALLRDLGYSDETTLIVDVGCNSGVSPPLLFFSCIHTNDLGHIPKWPPLNRQDFLICSRLCINAHICV